MSDKKEENKIKKETEEKKIARLEAELKDANDKYLRVLAEEQNLIKRQAAEKEEFVRYANREIILEFLDVYDHLKMSLEHTDAKENQWVRGIECIIKRFKDLLKANGIEEIETLGKKFDHAAMEAVSGKGETVKKQIKAGYKLNGKVIVAAKVILKD